MSSASSSSKSQQQPAADQNPSKLQRAKTNLTYLALGSGAAAAPSSLATRSFLNTTRYVLRYVIRRFLRYAKYAAVGALVAAVGGTLLGTLGSGLAFFAAPGIGVGTAIGVITAMARFGWRHRGNHFRGGIWEGMKARAEAGHDGAKDEAMDAKSVEEERRKSREDVWMRI